MARNQEDPISVQKRARAYNQSIHSDPLASSIMRKLLLQIVEKDELIHELKCEVDAYTDELHDAEAQLTRALA